MWNLIFLAAVTAAAPQVELRPLSGPAAAGQLVGISAGELLLEVGGTQQHWKTEDVLSLSFDHHAAPPAGTSELVIELLGGSRIVAQNCTVRDGKVSLTRAGGASLNVPTSAVRSVRFHRPLQASPLDKQWQTIISGQHTADLVVVRRSAAALDQLEGIIHAITDEIVEFEYEGQRIPVPRSKLEGVAYYQVAGQQAEEPLCRIQDIHGSQWHAASVRFEQQSDQLYLTTATGVEAALPLESLEKMDFSTGNIVYLSDLEPELLQWTPFFPSQLSQQLSRLNEPRRDQAFDGGKMLLAGQSFDKGLAIHSRTEVVFRIPANFTRFRALAGIDDRVRSVGQVQLTIWGDDQQLFDGPITGEQDPLPLDLNIAGRHRLRILVDFGGRQDMADHLNLCEARITK